MEKIINNIPTWINCLLFVAFCAGCYCLVLLLLRSQLKKETLKQNHDVTGVVFGLIGILYSLVLAFVVIAVWEDYEQIDNDVDKEASKLHVIMSHASELPDSMGNKINAAIKNYLEIVVNKEWSAMEANEVNELTSNALQYVRNVTFTAEGLSQKNQVIVRLIHDDITDVTDLRQERLTRNHSHVPGLVWMVLIVGSIITITFSYFFYVEPFWLRIVTGVFLTGMIALCLFLVFMLDHPFIGSSKVSSAPFQALLKEINDSGLQQ